MKKLIVLLLFIGSMFSAAALAQHFWRGELMPIDQIKKMWGTTKFDKSFFKNGSIPDRAKMSYDLIQSKIYVGKSRIEVINDLGPSDGYYFSGMVPAYLLNDPKTVGSDLWQLAFLLNSEGLIVEVVVHKNCCDKK